MENFLKFLRSAKDSLVSYNRNNLNPKRILLKLQNNLEKYSDIHIILGNESCDLDSTVSALALAFLTHSTSDSDKSLVIPILNVQAKYFPIRTETCHLLQQCGITMNMLVFRSLNTDT